MYSRPGLAYVFTGELNAKQIIARQQQWYDDLRLTLLFNRAQRIDTANQLVYLADGGSFALR